MKKHLISFPDFMQADIRVGSVTAVQSLPDSDKLYELTVDLGSDYGTVTILAGIAQYVAKKDLIGKAFLFVANLEPKDMACSTSHGMMLAADQDGAPLLLPAPPELPPGTPVH